MIYIARITTPKNTAASSLQKTTMNVTKGLVYKVDFYFPPGPEGLTGVAVFDGLFQVWPSSVGEFFISDDEVISFDDLYLKDAAPYNFDIYTYNTDDTYAHTVTVRIGLVSKDVYLARFLPMKGYDYFAKLLEKMAAEKEAQAAAQAEQLAETPYQWLVKQLGALE